MINYIRHDHEFYGVAKLSSGDEVMGVMIATKQDGQTLIFVEEPATPREAPVRKGDEVGLAIGLVKWMMWSDCLLYTSPSPRDATLSRMPSSA